MPEGRNVLAAHRMNPKAYRLPTHTLPRRYDIVLDSRLGTEQFQGHVTIQLQIVAPTDSIELHARDLQVRDACLTLEDQTLDGEVSLDADRELAIVRFTQTLPSGPATLDLTFEGKVSTGLEGLFLSKDGADELLATQCEATGARAILPCFDEPLFKARFAWRVTTAPGATVLTNSSLVSTEDSTDGASKTWTFAPTAPMSTYLLALSIGNIASTPERVVNGVPLRIWSLAGKEHLGENALDLTARLLPFYESYFAVPYRFGKLDQIGVPAFGAGAMENAGLIISQAVLLLLDEQTASRRQALNNAGVIAHEFAHMWFGDLVTMKWWDDIWLNEAFASWMSYHAIDHLHPEYRVWDEVQPGVDGALESDALAGSHSIYNPVETPAAITENFDNITYQKGGAVLRMVHDFLGDDAFRAGLRTYMREFAESNAEGADLWRHLQQASNQPVGQVMESWILQAGHPLVQVALEGSGADIRLRLRQRRFFSAAQAPANDQLWQVPMVIRYEDRAGVHKTPYLLTEREATVPLSVDGDLLWCYANAGEVGFYRQQLDPTLLQRLVAHLDRLAPSEQKGLLRDQWALVASGSQPIAGYLDVLGAAARGNDQTLIGQIVSDHLNRIETLLETAGDEQAISGFRAWVNRLFAGKLAALGGEPRPGESADDAQLRAYVLSAMTRFAHDPAAIALARDGQRREAIDPASVDPNIASALVGATARFGDAATYDQYKTIYEQRKAGDYTPQQVERYAFAFSRFEQPELAARTFELMQNDFFPFQNIAQIAATMMYQPRTAAAAWEFVKGFWPYVQEHAPFISPFIVQFSGGLPPALRDDVVTFWDANLKGEYAGPYARALEQMDQSAELQARTRSDLLAYFQAPRPTGGDTPSTAATSPTPTTPAAAPTPEQLPAIQGSAPQDVAPAAPAASATAPASTPIESTAATPMPAPAPPPVSGAADVGRAATSPSPSQPAAAAPSSHGGFAGWLRGLFGGRR